MLTPNHPNDERLSALSARDDDAVADAPLVAHVQACDRCAALVTELGALRVSLSELPDIAPERPLRLLPPVDTLARGGEDRLGGWVRRFFTPALTAGAALAMVGLVGTAAPALDGMAGGGDSGAAFEQAAVEADDAQEDARDGGGAPGSEGEPGLLSASGDPDDRRTTDDTATGEDGAPAAAELPAERSPWPMVLFTGVAVVIGAVVLRWILLPRAG